MQHSTVFFFLSSPLVFFFFYAASPPEYWARCLWCFRINSLSKTGFKRPFFYCNFVFYMRSASTTTYPCICIENSRLKQSQPIVSWKTTRYVSSGIICKISNGLLRPKIRNLVSWILKICIHKNFKMLLKNIKHCVEPKIWTV